MIAAPHLSLAALAPLLFVFGAACVGRARRGVRAPRRPAPGAGRRRPGRHPGRLRRTLLPARHAEVTAGGALAVDGAGLFLQATIAGLGALAILLFAERALDPARSAFVASAAVPVGSPRDRELPTSERVQTEVYPLTTFAIGGMMLFVAANDLLVMFVALEVLSLPLYLISGLARRRRLLSQEAAVKYFLLGAFASAFFLYGLALVYGATGSVRLARHPRGGGRRAAPTSCSCWGWRCSIVGLLFKASVAPFHTWTPDVYQGAPTPVTAFMAACTKVAAFGAILRLLYVALRHQRVDVAAADLRRRDRLDDRRRGARPDPDRPQADAGLLLDRARRASSSPASRLRRRPARGCRRRCSTCSPTA